ncbi:hypothetical protein HPP92_022622 [Vanilla planifolia]|uniref:Uncharacterized protein n=1 Tax=Vanilla planifolia TaxID=51239 RepID=A0A835UDT3_VANPL|nr:hypothetical protein HPP92_022622 [Vanilla planifolia]
MEAFGFLRLHLPQIFASNCSIGGPGGTRLRSSGAGFPKAQCCNKVQGQLFVMQDFSTTPFHRCIKPQQIHNLYTYEPRTCSSTDLKCCGVLGWFNISGRAILQGMVSFCENVASQDPLSVSVAILHQFNILPEISKLDTVVLRTGPGGFAFFRVPEPYSSAAFGFQVVSGHIRSSPFY